MDEVTGPTLVGNPISGITNLPPELVLLPGITNQTGKSLLFDGTNCINFGHLNYQCFGNLEMCPEGITIGAWIKIGQLVPTSSKYYIATGGQTGLAHGWSWLQKNGNFLFLAKTSTTKWDQASITLRLNTWTHIITSWHPSQGIKVFVDFILIKTITSSTAAPSPNALFNFTMGGSYHLSNPGLFVKLANFTIDELNILSKSVTPNMIKEMQLETIS